uniref:Uncharacterized protein n=1 Tax=Anopheles maculatus TaxID=74869 RepID=A0A182T2U2_9DIPT
MLYSRARSERNQNNASSGGGSGAGGGSAGAAGSAGSSNDGTASGSRSGGAGGSQSGAGNGGGGAAGSSAVISGSAQPGSGGSSSGGAGGPSGVSGGSGLNSAEREGFGRWRDRQYFGPRRWFQGGREDVWEKEAGGDSKKKDYSSGYPLWVSDEMEPWPEKDHAVRFTEIASLYSEFIGVTARGEIHQWRWADAEPYRSNDASNVHHPKTIPLNLLYEKVTHISATLIRCSVATESGRIATWMDELLGYAGNKLEHGATNYPEFALDRIVSLHTCTLYTVARTESGELFWWGVLPFGQRKRLWDKYQAKAKKPVRPSLNTPEVTVGAQVCMKSCPMYQHGAIGFTISNGVPKVGQLMNAAWEFTKVCRFKLLSMSTLSQQLAASTQGGSAGAASGGSVGGSGLGTSSTLSSSGIAAGALGAGPNANGGLGSQCSAVTLSGGMGGILDKDSKSGTSTGTPSGGGGGGGSSSGSGAVSSSKQGAGNNKESADRIDMPPPPSPASSTCSDTGSVTNSHKRPKRMTPKEEPDPKKDEEQWLLKDVIFVEDVRSVPIGRVLKVDGDFAAVKFPPPPGSSGSSLSSSSNNSGSNSKDKFDDSIEAWQDCRLLRKDDLQVIKSAATPRVPDCFQKIPRRIVLNPSAPSSSGSSDAIGGTSQLLTIAVDPK